MRSSPVIHWTPAWLMMAAAMLAMAPAPAEAREYRWALGGGAVSAMMSEDLNQIVQPVFFVPVAQSTFTTHVGNGTGFTFQGGFFFNKHIGMELLTGKTTHDATSSGFPGRTLNAELTTFFYAARGMLPLGDNWELFGRAGLGLYGLVVEDNVFVNQGEAGRDSRFRGTGIGMGGGVMMTLGRIGLELGYTQHFVEFNSVDVEGTSFLGFSQSTEEELSVGMVNLTVTFHFGGKL